MKKKSIKKLKKELTTETIKEEPREYKVEKKNLLSTGSTLLDLACSGNPFGGFLKGKYYFIVGDSASGKTFLSMSCFAEAAYNKNFQDYRLIYDDVEGGCLIDIEKLFGKKVVEKIEPPKTDDKGMPLYSETLEEFYYNLDDIINEGSPFVYVLDSMDCLSSKSEGEKFQQTKKAFVEGKAVPGSYGDGKAKINSAGLRQVVSKIPRNGSILIILNQTRDNIGLGYGKTRSGGRALRFYATVEFWSSVEKSITKTVKGKKRKVGTNIKVDFKKNRITGKLHSVEMPIYPSYGIDDITSCVAYLLDEGHWKLSKQTIIADDFAFEGTLEKLVAHIESNNLTKELKKLTGKVWREVEKACEPPRKGKYENASD